MRFPVWPEKQRWKKDLHRTVFDNLSAESCGKRKRFPYGVPRVANRTFISASHAAPITDMGIIRRYNQRFGLPGVRLTALPSRSGRSGSFSPFLQYSRRFCKRLLKIPAEYGILYLRGSLISISPRSL